VFPAGYGLKFLNINGIKFMIRRVCLCCYCMSEGFKCYILKLSIHLKFFPQNCIDMKEIYVMLCRTRNHIQGLLQDDRTESVPTSLCKSK
jgi:hypothetical protein